MKAAPDRPDVMRVWWGWIVHVKGLALQIKNVISMHRVLAYGMEASLSYVLKAALTAQGERVAAFKTWDVALAEFLKDCDVPKYRLQVIRAFTPIN
jgi:hypothetical protein